MRNSASRRTDIPAFYGRWFGRRLEAGYCLVPNPFNPGRVATVSLRREDVDAFVFWTRDPRPSCPKCGGHDMEAAPRLIVEKSRGTQMSIQGVHREFLCRECDADEILAKRARVADMYTERLREFEWLSPPKVKPHARMSWFVYVVTLAEGLARDPVMAVWRPMGSRCAAISIRFTGCRTSGDGWAIAISTYP